MRIRIVYPPADDDPWEAMLAHFGTAKALAAYVGVGTTTVRNWLNYVTTPRAAHRATLHAICRKLKLPDPNGIFS